MFWQVTKSMKFQAWYGFNVYIVVHSLLQLYKFPLKSGLDLPPQLVLCEVYADGFYRCFSDLQPLHDVRDGDNIYAVEIPNNSYSALTSSQVRPYIHGVYHGQPIKEPVTLLVINQVGYGRVGKRYSFCSFQVQCNVDHSHQLNV